MSKSKITWIIPGQQIITFEIKHAHRTQVSNILCFLKRFKGRKVTALQDEACNVRATITHIYDLLNELEESKPKNVHNIFDLAS